MEFQRKFTGILIAPSLAAKMPEYGIRTN